MKLPKILSLFRPSKTSLSNLFSLSLVLILFLQLTFPALVLANDIDTDLPPAIPTQTGYNENNGDPYAVPHPINELACTDAATNINGISIHWTDVSPSGTNVKYQRQYKVGTGGWTGNEVYTNPYTNYRSFGGGSGNEGIYGSRVRAWEDYDGDNVIDPNEMVSDWSNECSVTYDITAPEVTIDSIKYQNGTIEPSKFVTNYNIPVILGTASDQNSVTSVELTVNGYTYPAVISGNDWEAEITDILPEGVNTMVVVATDSAGNTTEIFKEIFIDTKAPSAVYTQYKDGRKIVDPIAYVKSTSQLSFTGMYSDGLPSSELFWDSFVIFEAQDDGSFRFSHDGKKAYCGWRKGPNLVHLSGNPFNLVDPVSFALCEDQLPDGEYYMAHHVYDNATRKDIPSINQFRDVLGLHFVVDTVRPEINLDLPIASTFHSGEIDLQATCNEECDYINFWWRAEGEAYSNTSPKKNYHYVHTNGTVFEWTIDSLNAERWGGDPSYTMPDGNYYFKAAGKDVAGNWARSEEVMVTVDNIPNDMDACKKGGWELYESLDFKNQGSCISYVMSNGHAHKREIRTHKIFEAMWEI